MLEFEISKILESQNDEVQFVGSFNLPPHIKHRMRQLDRVEVAPNMSYFLDRMTEERALEISLVDHFLRVAAKERLVELSLHKVKLTTWISPAHSMQHTPRDYNPTGAIAGIDMFVADPLATAAKNKADWIVNHLNRWQE